MGFVVNVGNEEKHACSRISQYKGEKMVTSEGLGISCIASLIFLCRLFPCDLLAVPNLNPKSGYA